MQLEHTATMGGRLSTVLREEMGISMGLMNRLKWKDMLLVNGVACHTDHPVRPGDVVTVVLDEPEPEYPAEFEPVNILYEDAYLLAADKPAGMLIHPSHSCFTGTFANRILGYYRKMGLSCAFHPVTRLDRDTYGIVLLAKNAHIHRLLHEQHNQGLFEKTYHALVFGRPDADSGVIDAPIARREKPSLLRYVDPAGKPSVTRYKVLAVREGFSKLELQPITGRTHQLRVHCAYKGFPILGDPQYGSHASAAFSAERGLTSQVLCAKELTFRHPITKEKMVLTSQMEGEMMYKLP